MAAGVPMRVLPEDPLLANCSPAIDAHGIPAERAIPATQDEPVKPSLPVLRPHLPSADRVLPYLRMIDESRVYSNFGPLNAQLETRLAMHLGLSPGSVTTASSGHAALLAAILAGTGRAKADRPLALIPAYTFVATAAAVEQAGYQPFLIDVDPESWMLDPQSLLRLPELGRVGLVVPVSAYGRPVEMQPWQAFHEESGIDVVIDGAAAFDTIAGHVPRHVGPLPLALSFHATKAFGTGEGGAVLSTDAGLIARVARSLNFGFSGSRDSASASTNGKMSEYHAAVGLAELDGWDDKLRCMRDVADRYRRALAGIGLADQFFASPEIGANYALLLCRDFSESARFQDSMRRQSVEFRYWYGLGLHQQSYYRQLPRSSLDATDLLAPCLLGLPFAPDLGELEIARVTEALADSLGGIP